MATPTVPPAADSALVALVQLVADPDAVAARLAELKAAETAAQAAIAGR